MKNALYTHAKQARKSTARKPVAKKPAPHRGSKRTETFLNAVMGLKLR